MSVSVYDPTASDQLSRVRGIGRYLQILKEVFPDWTFTDIIPTANHQSPITFINPFFNMLQPPLTMKRVAKKQIAVIHDLIPLKYPSHFPIGLKGKLNVFLNQLALHNYDAIVTDSNASKKDIIGILRLPESKIHVVYPCLPGIFTDPIKTVFDQRQSFSYCIYVGDATWNKNLTNLAKAIKLADVSCIFVGKVFNPANHQPLITNHLSHPWQKELKEFFILTKDDKQFIFKGFISDNELIKLYQQAICNVLPSRDEGFGFSYLEAASQHCPSIVSDIPVLYEISNGSALYADPENPDEIAAKITDMKNTKKLRDAIETKTHERSKFFSSIQFKKTFESLIASL